MGRFLLNQMERKTSLVYNDVNVEVLPDVFNPNFFTSSKLLIDRIVSIENQQNKLVLELGCGAGVASLLAAKKGMKVTATDINPVAIKGVNRNAENNGIKLQAIVSDLFDSVPKTKFDYLLINPPFYPKKPSEIKDNRWFCGTNFEYFERLFPDLTHYSSEDSTIWITLSDDCEIDLIEAIAKKSNWFFELVETRKQLMEKNFLFQLKRIN